MVERAETTLRHDQFHSALPTFLTEGAQTVSQQMARPDDTEVIDRFEEFYRSYYRNEIAELAQKYPSDQKSLYIDWGDLSRFDTDLADDFRNKPVQLRRYAEEALRLYDLPVDVSLGQAHVRPRGLPETTDIRAIRSDHRGMLIAVQGIIRKATDVRPKITTAAFECQRCGTLSRIPQDSGDFQEPHECQGCERQGPFQINYDQSEFIDAQKLRVQESPEGLRGGETPQSIDINIEDDITGEVTPGDHVSVTGVLKLEQQGSQQEKSPMFDIYMEGLAVEVEDEEFEEMDITDEDKKEIIELSSDPDIYEQIQGAIAPSIYGYEKEKTAMALQLFSGVTKFLPDGSRTRGDLHMLLIGDPGTGKCQHYDTDVLLADGRARKLGDIVEEHLDDPVEIEDGYRQTADIEVLTADGETVQEGRATQVWKREAPDRMYRIRTASGRELEVTPSHPLFVQEGGRLSPVEASELSEGATLAALRSAGGSDASERAVGLSADGGRVAVQSQMSGQSPVAAELGCDRIESIAVVEPEYEWVYDLEVAETHAYISEGIVSHNSALLQYVDNIAPRSVYTSGKGATSAGLTAAAVRDDFGDGQQWTLEAGALVLADQGIAAVDELDKMRCVTGDTLVHTAEGIRPIRELAFDADRDGDIEHHENGRTFRNIDDAVWTMSETGQLTVRDVTAVHEYDAPSELCTVTLESGESLTATPDHPFFVLDQGERTERPASELRPGDWVYVPDSIPTPASDGGILTAPAGGGTPATAVTPEHGAVLGYIAGDGSIYYDSEQGYGIRFTNKEEELLTDFECACREIFDTEPVRPPSEQRDDGVETVHVSGKVYVKELLAAGVNLETYEGKRVPAAVAQGSNEVKAAFVRALADSEGAVDYHKVTISSASYELLLGTKMLLAEFGITAQIQTDQRDDRRDVYTLAVTAADSLARFRDQIGFVLGRKQSALDAVFERVSGDRTILDVLPGCGALFAEARESLRLYQSECGLNGATYCNFENGDANFSLLRAERVLERFADRRAEARSDAETLSTACSWETLSELRKRYHAPQHELAETTEYSQQQVSARWGEDEQLRDVIRRRLQTLLKNVEETDISELRDLIRGDVKWRRVTDVEETEPTVTDGQIPVLEHRLADLLQADQNEAEQRATEVLGTEPTAESWSELRDELERHAMPLQRIADRMDVANSTVSRWCNGLVDGESLETVWEVARDLIEAKRNRVRALLAELEDRQEPNVYDLTVEGTHNFLANGMVVHNSEDQSAMHQALEEQSISVNKAGINATLKSRCSLLGAANPAMGRFDKYESMAEQIDLTPPLISRFDLIFTVTDKPDPEEDAELAEHIIQTNYAGELNTHRTEVNSSNYSAEEVDRVTEEVAPTIEPDLLRKYIAFARRTCFPTMTEEAKNRIQEFYVDLRAEGTAEDAPVPVTARKLEALVRLAEASARVRLSDTVERADADRAVDIAHYCLKEIGLDPETGELDADVIETGTSKTQRDRVKNLLDIVADIEDEYDEGAPVDVVVERAEEVGVSPDKAEHEIEKLKQKGEIYQPKKDHLRTT